MSLVASADKIEGRRYSLTRFGGEFGRAVARPYCSEPRGPSFAGFPPTPLPAFPHKSLRPGARKRGPGGERKLPAIWLTRVRWSCLTDQTRATAPGRGVQ